MVHNNLHVHARAQALAPILHAMLDIWNRLQSCRDDSVISTRLKPLSKAGTSMSNYKDITIALMASLA